MAAAGVAAAGEVPAVGVAAAGVVQCGSSSVEADAPQRLTVGLHAFMLVLRAVKERGMW